MGTPRQVITREDIAARIEELGKRVGADYAGRDLVLVGMLKGATV